jgi:hypothetical protein
MDTERFYMVYIYGMFIINYSLIKVFLPSRVTHHESIYVLFMLTSVKLIFFKRLFLSFSMLP